MLDSGLKDVHQEGIAKLYDKFAVEMNDTEAEKHFLMVSSALSWTSHFNVFTHLNMDSSSSFLIYRELK